MRVRIAVLIFCFTCASLFLIRASKIEAVGVRQPLVSMPLEIANWKGHDAPALTDKVLALLNVTDYVDRIYIDNSSSAPTDLYIGFYESQRQGAAIHSPMNCLPGAGWNPTDRSELAVSVKSNSGVPRNISINRVIVEHSEEQDLVLYWYQSHGRVIASEYWGKFYSVFDAMRINRTDAALVRVITPIETRKAQGTATAEASAVHFVQQIFPLLSQYLPD